MSFVIHSEEELSLESEARHLKVERPPHRGPGWFDSSWDLRCGCEVREGWPGDVGLREWIERWLYAGGGVGAAGEASFSAT
jgi:hypothetical protein